ncbi:MAG: NAD-dependent epimerase/dehydratase family protein [Clostridiales bacterium]|nr:NAD-dependent epimerase/dehydratase family protein [Clostridiales bacterium]
MLEINQTVLEDLKAIVSEDIDWQKLKGSKVVVTGANGMIASYVCLSLLYINDIMDLGIKVIALVRNKMRGESKFSNILHRKDFVMLVQDVCDELKYKEGFDYLIHAASPTSPSQFISNPVGTIKANTMGTINMLDVAVERKVKGFMILSTREVYGSFSDNRDFVNENDFGAVNPALVRSCYPEGKRLSETLCSAYKHQYKLNCKVARIAHTYGPGMQISDGRVVGDFIGNVVKGENITMNSDGSSVLGLTYISDLIRGLFRLLLDFEDMTYNISSKQSVVTVKELADTLAKLYKERKINVVQTTVNANIRRGYLSNKVPLLDSTKAETEGWISQVSIQEGLKRTIEYFDNEYKCKIL